MKGSTTQVTNASDKGRMRDDWKNKCDSQGPSPLLLLFNNKISTCGLWKIQTIQKSFSQSILHPLRLNENNKDKNNERRVKEDTL